MFSNANNNSLILKRIIDKEPIEFDTKNITFASQFVLLSPIEAINNWAFYLSIFTNLVVIDGQEISAFSSRQMWLVQRNYFAEYFSSLIARLVASGIYAKWQKDYDKNRTFSDVKAIMGENGASLWDRLPSLFASISLRDKSLSGRRVDMDEDKSNAPSPLTIKAFMSGVYGYGVLLALCVILFCLECSLLIITRVEKNFSEV